MPETFKVYASNELLHQEKALDDCFVSGTLVGVSDHIGASQLIIPGLFVNSVTQKFPGVGFYLDDLFCTRFETGCNQFKIDKDNALMRVSAWLDSRKGKLITVYGQYDPDTRRLRVSNLFKEQDLSDPFIFWN